MLRYLVALVCLAGLASAEHGLAAEPHEGKSPLFPFVLPWNDDSPAVTNLSAWLSAPAGRDGHVVVRDGHLHAGNKRLRLFGVNLCFAANFPMHGEARQIAARMAKFGINCVRFHHMDMQTTPSGIFAADGRTLAAGQLDRLDFFIAELKKHGIYADLNLHVSRSYPDMPEWRGMPSFFKGVDNFFPAMIEWQRGYARDLLTHVNPYTKTRYAEEPAVALVEINNENALSHEWWSGALDDMPDGYAGELRRQWNAWLEKKYPDFEALARAWRVGASPLGRELLVNGDFSQDREHWTLEQHAGAQATARVTPGGAGRSSELRIQVERAGQEAWHVQLGQSKLALDEGKSYTLRFRARADAPRRLDIAASQAHEPWRVLWAGGAELTSDWKEFQFRFTPAATDGNGRIVLGGLGRAKGNVWLADVSLRPGGVAGVRPGERSGKVEWLTKRDFGGRTAAAQRDWIAFLWDTERTYWSGMARYLRNDLGVRALLVGTQMGWSPFPVQAELDVIDSHAYWQHPNFPGRDWDMDNWTVNNVPMAGAAHGDTLTDLGLSRVAGKPFICTEYNHSAPNTYAAEAFPLIAAYAAVQDWDGIFAFAYSHRDDWDARRIPSFFDIDQHPTKMATLPASVAMFIRGDVRPALARWVVQPSLEELVDRARRGGPRLSAEMFGLSRGYAFMDRVAVALPGGAAAAAVFARKNEFEFLWNPSDHAECATIDAPRSKAVVGKFPPGERFALGDVEILAGETRQDWATVLLTAIDGDDFQSPGRLLITAAGYAENTAMGWKNEQKSTVGSDWGRPPSLVEGVGAQIVLPVPAARVRAWSLDERGQRKAAIQINAQGSQAKLAIGPAYETLWYEVAIATRGEKQNRDN